MNNVYAVGIGPGGARQMSAEAAEVLKSCDMIIGYTVYVELVREQFPDKEYRTTPMTKESERCRMALEEAKKGKEVAVVCSGDAGVYGMAGLLYELGTEFPKVQVQVVPGITAALGGAAVLGAPLSHDFAVISLSDLLTPWEKIEKRIRAAAMAELCICLYNPASRKRTDHLRRACEYMLEYKRPDTVCGVVQHIGRAGENSRLLTLEELKETTVDMFTTVFIGNDQTKNISGKMVTPRGYREESQHA